MAPDKTYRLAQAGLVMCVIAALIALAVLGQYDANEGWYANDLYLVSEGLRPYHDFFYHRLPLFLYTMAPVHWAVPMEWVSLRLYYAAFAVLAVLGTIVLLRHESRRVRLLATAFFIVNLQGLHIFSTVQVYAIVGCCFVAMLLVVDRVRQPLLQIGLLAALCVVAQWMRYPIDYVPVAFFLFLSVHYWRRWSVMAFGLALFLLLHAAMAGYFASDAFWHDVWFGMSPHTGTDQLLAAVSPRASIENWLRYKSEWLVFGVRWFFPIVLLAVPLGIAVVRRMWQDGAWRATAVRHPAVLLGLLLSAGNTAMYLLAPEGHVVQMYYVFPVMIYLTCRLCGWAVRHLARPAMTAVSACVGLLLLCAPWLHDRVFAGSIASAHTTAVTAIAQALRAQCAAGEELLTFTPIVAMASHLRITPALAFETYGYFDSLDDAVARRYHLMNRALLRERLRRAQPCAVHLDDRFYAPTGSAIRLRPMQTEFLETLQAEYPRGMQYDQAPWNLVRGRVTIHFRSL